MRISDWSSDVCSSDLVLRPADGGVALRRLAEVHRIARAERLVRRLEGALVAVVDPREQEMRGIEARERTPGLGGERLDLRQRIGEHLRRDDVRDIAVSSEERRVGIEGVSTCRSRWTPDT